MLDLINDFQNVLKQFEKVERHSKTTNDISELLKNGAGLYNDNKPKGTKL